jgi:hypothetical protein
MPYTVFIKMTSLKVKKLPPVIPSLRSGQRLSDSEQFDIIEILRPIHFVQGFGSPAPQNDTVWTFYECINLEYPVNPVKKRKSLKFGHLRKLLHKKDKVGISFEGRKVVEE